MWFHIMQIYVNMQGLDNEGFTLLYHVELGSDVCIMLYGRKSYRPMSILRFLFEFTKGAQIDDKDTNSSNIYNMEIAK